MTQITQKRSQTRNQKPETRNQKPETRNQKPETRNQKPETRNTLRYLWASAFHKDHIAPHLAQLADPFSTPYLSKSATPMQSDACFVLRKYPRLKRPNSAPFRFQN